MKKIPKKIQSGFRLEKVTKRKGGNLYIKWKDYDNSFNSRVDKKRLSQYFPKPYHFGRNIKVELDLPNYNKS